MSDKYRLVFRDSNKSKYTYKGSVKKFGKIVISNFDVETEAVSLDEAYSNFLYQAKRRLGLVASAKLEIDKSKIKLVKDTKPTVKKESNPDRNYYDDPDYNIPDECGLNMQDSDNKEIKYKGYTIVFDDYVNGYVIYNENDEDATAGHVFKSIRKAKDEIDLGDLNYPNSEEDKYYGVWAKGGYVGSKNRFVETGLTKEEAKELASRLRKSLSPGEKKYYGMTYLVKKTPNTIKDAKDNCLGAKLGDVIVDTKTGKEGKVVKTGQSGNYSIIYVDFGGANPRRIVPMDDAQLYGRYILKD